MNGTLVRKIFYDELIEYLDQKKDGSCCSNELARND